MNTPDTVKIELTRPQLQMLLQIVNNGNYPGQFVEQVVELKQALQAAIDVPASPQPAQEE